VKVYNNLHGPARKNRKLCVNETDFFTMDPISEISYAQFFSFKDTDEMIYGFDILSLHNLILKSGKILTNPYNRNIIHQTIKNDIKKLIKFGKFINEKLDINIDEVNKSLDPKKIMELRIKSLFQEMDSLGNYTNSDLYENYMIYGNIGPI
jgi:TATA-box binding protein (TBP) (component of TFIID and TFIIIB)